MLSLAAGSVLGADPLETIRVAAAAGFDAVGLRLDSVDLSAHALPAIRAALSDAGLVLLDVEVLWLRPDVPDPLPLVDAAAELGARHVLVVSLEPSLERTAERLRALCEHAEASATALRVALEFPGYTTVGSLAAAVQAVTQAVHPRAAVMVDSLHLARTGGKAADLVRVPQGLLPYIQVCDARSAAVADDQSAYMAEARGGRLLPGQGCLPLESLVTTFRARPEAMGVSVEVISEDLARQYSPAERAHLAFAAAAPLLRAKRAS